MAVRHPWMVEVIGRVVRHSELPHDRLRAYVLYSGQRDDLGQSRHGEAISERLPRRLGGVALSPTVSGQPEADLDRGREVCLERLAGQASEADEPARIDLFHGPQPEPMLAKPSLDPIDRRVAFLARQRGD